MAVANARLAPKALVAEKAGRPLPLEMWGPTHMYHMYQSQKAPAMWAPMVELPMDWSARKATGHQTPVSGLPRELEWPMRQAACHQAPVPELPALQPAAAEEVVATAQVALAASNPKVGGE